VTDDELFACLLLYVLKQVGPVELPSIDFDEWLERNTESLELRFHKPANQTTVSISAATEKYPGLPGVRLYQNGELIEEFN
jgi:hypothetical protein